MNFPKKHPYRNGGYKKTLKIQEKPANNLQFAGFYDKYADVYGFKGVGFFS